MSKHRLCADCATHKAVTQYTASHIVCNDCMRECIQYDIELLEAELEIVDDGSRRADIIISELGELDRELEQL